MKESDDHVCICICTYKRPHLLGMLLDKLQSLETEGLFSISIVVVDNDFEETGKEAVRTAENSSKWKISYYVEPERNISLARNLSVERATGTLIAFIDDDEIPDQAWLIRLYRTLQKSNSAGVLGPVKPILDSKMPGWLVRSGLLKRKLFPTGTMMRDSRYTRTGNVLLKKSLFSVPDNRFDPAYGRTGGGDAIFFKKMIDQGESFVWCNEAVVFETIPPERRVKSYYIKRAFTRGMTESLETPILSMSTFRSLIALPFYGLPLPFTLIFGQHVFMRFLIKECDHLSKILAHLGLKIIKERPY